MTKRIDLHTHSHYSDGTLSPAEVVRCAHQAGVGLLVLTDHDSISGFSEALAAAQPLGLQCFCGIEINTCENDQLHILGYGIDPGSTSLKAQLEEFRDRRHRRILKIIDNLRGVGVDISWEDVKGVSKQSLGRPHVADALRRKRMVGSRKEAFERFLIRGKPGYVDPMGPTSEEAISTIREAGGWASLAHPGTINMEENLKRLVDYGLEGIEVFYPSHTNATIQNLLSLAASYRLIPTGGSDFHGPKTGRETIGGVAITPEHLDRVMGRLGVAR